MNQLKTALFGLSLLFSLSSLAQNEVLLQIHHMVNGETADVNTSYAINGTEVQIDRLEYYLCDFVITHDGGQETAIEAKYVLANAFDDGLYSLGNWDINSVEKISFGVGVDADHNVGIDPSTYPEEHPLAPQFPSMHWGWASGYRFLALEGYGGESLAAQHQVHALGDNNFFWQSHQVDGSASEGAVTISLNANYEGLFNGLPVAQGFIEHSDNGLATVSMQNMRNAVFESSGTVGVSDLSAGVQMNVYPNPASDWIVLDASSQRTATHWKILNAWGQIEMQGALRPKTEISISDLAAGWHVVSIENDHGHALTNRSFVKQ